MVAYLPLQSGGLSVRITCPYRHVAVSPPKLVYPPGQLNIKVLLCSAGSAGSVTTSLHAGSRFVQSASERLFFEPVSSERFVLIHSRK